MLVCYTFKHRLDLRNMARNCVFQSHSHIGEQFLQTFVINDHIWVSLMCQVNCQIVKYSQCACMYWSNADMYIYYWLFLGAWIVCACVCLCTHVKLISWLSFSVHAQQRIIVVIYVSVCLLPPLLFLC